MKTLRLVFCILLVFALIFSATLADKAKEEKKAYKILKQIKKAGLPLESFFIPKKPKHKPVNPKKINYKMLKHWDKMINQTHFENLEKKKKMSTLADPAKPAQEMDWG